MARMQLAMHRSMPKLDSNRSCHACSNKLAICRGLCIVGSVLVCSWQVSLGCCWAMFSLPIPICTRSSAFAVLVKILLLSSRLAQSGSPASITSNPSCDASSADGLEQKLRERPGVSGNPKCHSWSLHWHIMQSGHSQKMLILCVTHR